MKKQVLINVEDKDIRVAVLEDGDVTQLFIEQLEEKSIVGNIYKAKVESIVPSLQAAFVNIGLERNAFLHFSDISREYIIPSSANPAQAGRRGKQDKDDEASGSSKSAKKRPKELKTGEEVLVQVVKEPINTKGARVTMQVSVPGRYLVFLPHSERNGGGVSRRIENANERRRLRSILSKFEAPEGGFIIRTAGLEHEEEEIGSDVKKLESLWQRITRSAARKKAPSLVHDDHEILGRLVRDEFTEDIDELIIDSKEHARQLRQALKLMLPELQKKVVVHDSPDQNVFDRYDVERQFQKALGKRVWLKSGGYIIIDETEALIAIDVNTGKFTSKQNQEETIYRTNLEAAETIVRQLSLRDVGGLIVIDFIDMRSRDNQKNLVKSFKSLLKKDRAKTSISNLSEFGLLEMTRKRVRQSLRRVIFKKCPYCQGSGQVLSEQRIWKNIKYDILEVLTNQPNAKTLRISVNPEFRDYIEKEMMDAARGLANRGAAALDFVDNDAYRIFEYDVSVVEQG